MTEKLNWKNLMNGIDVDGPIGFLSGIIMLFIYKGNLLFAGLNFSVLLDTFIVGALGGAAGFIGHKSLSWLYNRFIKKS